MPDMIKRMKYAKKYSDEMAARPGQPLPAKHPGKKDEDARETGKQERAESPEWQSAIEELGERHVHNEKGH